MQSLREDANLIIQNSLQRVLPDNAVVQALKNKDFKGGKVRVVAAGKAAWQMAKAASDFLGDSIECGIVVTKYGHVKGEIPRMQCFEAAHPVPDENSFKSTQAALELVQGLSPADTVIFLLSGGASALFEKPLVSGEELSVVTKALLACGADIVEINTIRKRLSAVKGGKFAKLCEPAHVFAIVLSDILGDPPDMIASGPAWPDSSDCASALAIAEKYKLPLSEKALECLRTETPKSLSNVEMMITGSVRELCRAAADECTKLGYEPHILTDMLDCEAREAGAFFAAIAKTYSKAEKSLAYIAGGETVVHLTGKGKGGRNQELALSAAQGIAGLSNVAVFSIGSDGTDGPTDAAGGFCDGQTKSALAKLGINIYDILKENNAYVALEQCGGLIKTGATGTNVNDVSVLLIQKQ